MLLGCTNQDFVVTHPTALPTDTKETAELVEPSTTEPASDMLPTMTRTDSSSQSKPIPGEVVVERVESSSSTVHYEDWLDPFPTVTRPEKLSATVPTPEALVVEIMDGGPSHYGFTSLEHRIFASDAVVWARLRTITAKGALYHCGVFAFEEDYWIPVIELGFEVLEYLKGDGDDRLFIEVSFGWWGNSYNSTRYVYSNESDAIRSAHIAITEGYYDLIEGDVLLFVENTDALHSRCDVKDEATDVFSFTLMGHPQSPEFGISSEFNRVWLPAVDQSVDWSEKDASTIRFKLSADSDLGTQRDERYGRHGTIGTDEISEMVNELEDAMNEADETGVVSYNECLKAKFERETLNLAASESGGKLVRHWWDHEVGPFQREILLYSGIPAANTVLGSTWEVQSQFEYNDTEGDETDSDAIWLSGKDAALFQLVEYSEIVEGRKYISKDVVAKRVLPAGAYSVEINQQEARFRPCEYYDESSRTIFDVQAIASNDVLLEALFDPVDVDGGLGTSDVDGRLHSDTLEVNGNEVSIDKLLWRNGKLSLMWRGAYPIDALTFEFIDNDGNTVLELDTTEATVEPAGEAGAWLQHWKIDVEPWNAGDTLMLRIGTSEKAGVGDGRAVVVASPICVLNVVEALGNGSYFVDVEWPRHGCRGIGTAGISNSAVRYAVVRVDEPGFVKVSTPYMCPGTRWWVRSSADIGGDILREISDDDDLKGENYFSFQVQQPGEYTIEMNAIIPDRCVVQRFSISLN